MIARSSSNTLRTGLLIAIAIAVAGCELWPNEAGYPYTTTDPISDFGSSIQRVYALITYWVFGIFAVVSALYFYTLFRFRDDGSEGNPEQIHGNTQLEIGWTLVPILIVLVLIIPTVQTIFEIADAPPMGAVDDEGNVLVDEAGAPLKPTVEIEVVGKRWWWAFNYMSEGITTGNQFAIPDDRPVSLLISSDTIIHSFWAPRIGGKRDAVPGRVNRLWFNLEIDVPPGEVEHVRGECAEYCGEAHALMRFEVLALDGDDYDTWVAEYQAGPKLDPAVKQAGEAAFTEGGCIGCHAITGNDLAAGQVGPDLTFFGDRRWLAAGVHDLFPNGRDDQSVARDMLTTWIRNPNSLKPGTALLDNGTPRPDGMMIPAAGPDGILTADEFGDTKLNAIIDYLLAQQSSFPLN